jgi:hypothetical protein
MGSSYRDDLNRGYMPEWETKLRQAITLIQEVSEAVSECVGSDGQFDNAADDGALREKLWGAMAIIRAELPMTQEEKAEKIERLERQLDALKRA